MTDIESMNDKELREIVLSQSNAICRLIRQLERQETISEIQKMAMEDAKTPRWSWMPYSTSSAPAANDRYLVKLANDWVCCATYYLDHQKDGNCQWKWKDDRAQEIVSVKFWKGLEE